MKKIFRSRVGSYIFDGLLPALLCLSTLAVAQTEFARLQAVFDADWKWRIENQPEFATYVGVAGQDHRWSDMSASGIEARKRYRRELLNVIGSIETGVFTEQERLNYDLFARGLSMDVAGDRFPSELLPIDQRAGVQQDAPYLLSYSPARTVEDYENMLQRLRGLPDRVHQEIALLKRGLEAGITPPKITLRNVLSQTLAQTPGDPAEAPLFVPFSQIPDGIPRTASTRLIDEAKSILVDEIYPAYRELYDYLDRTYIPGARESVGWSELPDGAAWYEYLIRYYTTTNMNAEEIHRLGLSEVERIRKQMNAVIREVGFDGTFAEFCEFLRSDPQFYYEREEDLVREYRNIAKRIDPELPNLFGKLPRLPYGVKVIPAYAAKSQTTAYYSPGSPQAGRAGTYFVNTYALDTRPTWEMEALTVHEAVPGHHLQISLAQEMEDVPEFRRWQMPTAFVEGWGLYSEGLGYDIGLYQDPYSRFGQLTYEIWRAVRLVVDTGIHAKGWSRQQAIDYFAANSSKQLHDITVEIDRYINTPGQALAYKIGQLKFLELRERAQAALGSAFDIRRFHDACLENGAVPLDVLEAHIMNWIEQESTSGN